MALAPEVVAQRLSVIREMKEKGATQTVIAKRLNLSQVAVCLFLKSYGQGIKFSMGRPTLSRPSEARAVERQGGSLPPLSITEEAVERTIAILGCTRERALFVLSCPMGGKAHGWRGGAAIG